MPDLGTVHIDQALTNVSLRYSNDMFAANIVAPPLPVEKRSDKYFIYGKESGLQSSGKRDANGNAASLRRPSTEAHQITYSLSTDNYYAEEYALRELVSDAERRLADNPLQPEIDATLQLADTLLIDNELSVANLVCNANNFAASNKATLTTGGAGTSWASYASANSVPMLNLLTAKVAIRKSAAKMANSLLINHAAAATLSEHPNYRDEFKYVSQEGLTASNLAPVIKGLRVTEATAQYENGDIWLGSDTFPMALVHYASPGTGPRTVHFARTFDAPDDTTGAKGLNTRKYRWDPLKGDYVETAMTRDYKIVSKDANGKATAGYLFLSVNV